MAERLLAACVTCLVEQAIVAKGPVPRDISVSERQAAPQSSPLQYSKLIMTSRFGNHFVIRSWLKAYTFLTGTATSHSSPYR